MTEARIQCCGPETACPLCGANDAPCTWRPDANEYTCYGKVNSSGKFQEVRQLLNGGRVYRLRHGHGRAADENALAPIRRKMAEVTAERVSWLWHEHIPLRAVSLLTGRMGEGKSIISAAWAAAVTGGYGWPDMPTATFAEPANVIVVVAEDDLATVVRPRLDAAGADAARIEALTMMHDPESGRDFLFNVQRDAPALREIIRDIGNVKLVIIDPLATFLSRIDTHRHSDTYAALAPLAGIAQTEDLAIVGVHHHSKTVSTDALARVMGSSAFAAIARAVFSVYPDPDSDCRNDKILACAKLNVCQKPPALRYRIASAENGIGIIAWNPEPVDADANDILARLEQRQRQDSGDKTALEQAKDFLREALADGPRPSKDLDQQADAQGIARRTLQRAKAELRVKSYQQRDDHKVSGWLVALPYQPDPNGDAEQ